MLRPHAKAASLRSSIFLKCDCSAQKYYQDVNRPPFARSPVLTAAKMAGTCNRATRFRCWEAENSQPWAPLFIPDSAPGRQAIYLRLGNWGILYAGLGQAVWSMPTNRPVNLA